MARGRKPQPAELKEARNNPGKRPVKVVSSDVLAPLGAEPPDHLAAKAKEVWAELQPILARNRILRVSDGPMFERYCQLLHYFWEADREVQEKGMNYRTESKHGEMDRETPGFKAMLQLNKQLKDMEKELCLTPVSRSQVMQRLALTGTAMPREDGEGQGGLNLDSSSPVGALRRADGGSVH